MKKRRNLLNFKTVFSLVIVALLIVVIVVLFVMNRTTYNDDYFVTDDTKVVLSMDARTSGFEESEYAPPITHVVYYYSGDTINNVKVFYEYRNSDIAKKAYVKIDAEDKYWAYSRTLNDKYIIFDMKKEEYEGLTATEIRESAEATMENDEFDRESSFHYGYDGQDIPENDD